MARQMPMQHTLTQPIFFTVGFFNALYCGMSTRWLRAGEQDAVHARRHVTTAD